MPNYANNTGNHTISSMAARGSTFAGRINLGSLAGLVIPFSCASGSPSSIVIGTTGTYFSVHDGGGAGLYVDKSDGSIFQDDFSWALEPDGGAGDDSVTISFKALITGGEGPIAKTLTLATPDYGVWSPNNEAASDYPANWNFDDGADGARFTLNNGQGTTNPNVVQSDPTTPLALGVYTLTLQAVDTNDSSFYSTQTWSVTVVGGGGVAVLDTPHMRLGLGLNL